MGCFIAMAKVKDSLLAMMIGCMLWSLCLHNVPFFGGVLPVIKIIEWNPNWLGILSRNIYITKSESSRKRVLRWWSTQRSVCNFRKKITGWASQRRPRRKIKSVCCCVLKCIFFSTKCVHGYCNFLFFL